MDFIPVINCAMVEVVYEQYGSKMENTLYFVHPDGITYNRLKACAEGVGDWWDEQLSNHQMNNLTLQYVQARQLDTESGLIYQDTRYTGEYGKFVSGYGLPSNVSFCVSFRTGFVGRWSRGRNYCVALSSQMVDGNFINSSVRNALLGYYEELLFPSDYMGDNWCWVVVSRYYDHQPREQGTCLTVTSVIAVNDALDSMRNRLAGRGE